MTSTLDPILERYVLQNFRVFRAVVDLCLETNPAAPGKGCILSRQQIAARSKLSGMVVNQGMAWLRTNHVMFVRWRYGKSWEVRFDARFIRQVLAGPLPWALVLIEEERKRRQQLSPTRALCPSERKV